MTIRARLFARCRELAGTEALELHLPPDARVDDVRRRLAEVCPALAAILPACAVGVGDAIAGDCEPVHPGVEVAILPPVSGG